MMERLKQHAKTLILLLAATAILAAAAWLIVKEYWPRRPWIDERTTLSILRSEAMTFVVTRRLATQLVVEHEQGDWLGEWRGVLWATVRLHYGVDLRKVQPGDIHREGGTLIVRLPESELLDFSIEPGSEGFLSKSTSVAKIQDLLHNGQRRQLEQRLRQRCLEFAASQGILPTRAEIVGQLNAAAAAMGAGGQAPVRFE